MQEEMTKAFRVFIISQQRWDHSHICQLDGLHLRCKQSSGSMKCGHYWSFEKNGCTCIFKEFAMMKVGYNLQKQWWSA
jgi:hypothetical protein